MEHVWPRQTHTDYLEKVYEDPQGSETSPQKQPSAGHNPIFILSFEALKTHKGGASIQHSLKRINTLDPQFLLELLVLQLAPKCSQSYDLTFWGNVLKTPIELSRESRSTKEQPFEHLFFAVNSDSALFVTWLWFRIGRPKPGQVDLHRYRSLIRFDRSQLRCQVAGGSWQILA